MAGRAGEPHWRSQWHTSGSRILVCLAEPRHTLRPAPVRGGGAGCEGVVRYFALDGQPSCFNRS
jgi:hypothetical protein